MATHSGAVTSSDAQYRLGFSSRLYYEATAKSPVMSVLREDGCINIENDLTKSGGGTVTLYNQQQVKGKPVRGDVDFYTSAEQMSTNSRTLNIAKVSKPVQWYMKGSQSQQFAPFQFGEYVAEGVSDYIRSTIESSVINQVAGNNASSITQTALDDTAFSGGDLLSVTGNNTAAAPTYWYEANLGGVITTDSGVGSGNTLSLKDFEIAATNITQQIAGRTRWQTLKGKKYLANAFISYTGLFQLNNEAVTLGQGSQLSNIVANILAGGKEVEADLTQFMLPSLPFKFVVVPDSWMPRGVTTSGLAETANTRRAVIVGANALDFSFGAGYEAGGKAIPGMNVEMDTTYKPLNKMGYGNASALFGCKKAQATGSGTFAGTSYDMSTYVITHYSAA
jgi:hypothetical protein